jgi:GntR family histidine utilization transcriptional repressor
MDVTETEKPEEPMSLHQRILGDISMRILSGEWLPGHRIPYEYELSEQYNCSRMTVNKALSQLAKAGLIERRRRSGSFVRTPKSQAAILEINDVRTEVQALGLPYRYELVGRTVRKATAADRDRLGVDTGTRVLALSCRHFAGLRPFCLEDRLISLATVPDAEAESFANTAPGPWLIGRVPWSAAEHRIRATGTDAAIASGLDIDPGTACLVVERQTWSADQPVTHVRFTYPGDSHTLVARFTPSQG